MKLALKLFGSPRYWLNVHRKATTSSLRLYSTAKVNEDPKMSSHKSNDYFDIVVCGGGMVGTAMAYALGKEEMFKNLKIALIESSAPKQNYSVAPIHSNRVCALSDKTVNLFKCKHMHSCIFK